MSLDLPLSTVVHSFVSIMLLPSLMWSRAQREESHVSKENQGELIFNYKNTPLQEGWLVTGSSGDQAFPTVAPLGLMP